MKTLATILFSLIISTAHLLTPSDVVACDSNYHSIYGVIVRTDGKVYTRLVGCGSTWYRVKDGDYLDRMISTLLLAKTTNREVRVTLDSSSMIEKIRLH